MPEGRAEPEEAAVKRWIALAALTASLLVPQTAAADAGSIAITSNTYAGTPGYAYVGVSVTVTKSTCDWDSTYCGWFPFVTEVESTQACTSDGTRYVGNSVDGTGTYTQDLGTALLDGTSKKLCLYVSSNENHYLTETVVQLNSNPSPAPSPSPSPTTIPAQPDTTPPLSIAEARGYLKGILRDKFHGRFTHRKHYKGSCYRYSSQKVRCRVRWDYKNRYRYSGSITMRNDPDDPEGSFLYTTSIKRKRFHHPRRHATPRPQAPSRPAPSCDSNYSGCLDPDAYDYDCLGGSGDGPRYTGPVRVIGDDHYGLDRDGDGVGCDE
jgi:hypothetical protein